MSRRRRNSPLTNESNVYASGEEVEFELVASGVNVAGRHWIVARKERKRRNRTENGGMVRLHED